MFSTIEEEIARGRGGGGGVFSESSVFCSCIHGEGRMIYEVALFIFDGAARFVHRESLYLRFLVLVLYVCGFRDLYGLVS